MGITTRASIIPGKFLVDNHINFNLYHYAGNNPVRYLDPDGRKTLPLTDKQWEVVKTTISQASNNLSSLISELRNSNNDISKLNPIIVDSARTFLTSEFGNCSMDCSVLANYLEDIKNQIDKLDRNDIKYNDKRCRIFAKINPYTGKIKLYDKFFNANMKKKYDSKEGVIIHEVSHNIFALWSLDITYEIDEMKNLKDDGLCPKGWNANNWEYFYEEIFN